MPTQLFAPTTPAGIEPPPDVEADEQRALLRALLVTVEHYFGGFTRLFGSVADPRQPALITYPLPMVLAAGGAGDAPGPRDRFVPREQRAFAWDNAALPIGCGRTISQPSLVAYMTRQLALQPGDKVLEIGTGSGYQAAILAAMGLWTSIRSKSCLNWQRGLRLCTRRSASPASISGTATVSAAGRSMPPSMRSWSPHRRHECQRPCWTSWPMGAAGGASRAAVGMPDVVQVCQGGRHDHGD